MTDSELTSKDYNATADQVQRDGQETSTTEQPNPSSAAFTTFTNRQRWLLVSLASIAATFSGFSSNIYFPALPQIAHDLHVSVTLVNLSVTTYMILQGIAPSFWGAIADVKGRRIAYILTFLVYLAACIGLANTKDYAKLLALRCIQSAGSASTIAIGAGVIGDITTRAERGGFMGIYQTGLLAPVSIGPVIGGALANALGWRSVFWFLAIYSGAFFVFLVLFFPETLRSIVGNGSQLPSGFLLRFPLTLYQKYQPAFEEERAKLVTLPPKKQIDFIEPFRILVSKQAVSVVGFLAIYYAVWQMSITIMSTLFSSIYHLNETAIGLTFIANGVGSAVGTLTTGKLLDSDYDRFKAKYDSELVEGSLTQKVFPIKQARLRLVPIFAALQIGSILVFGWTLNYHLHIAAPIVSTFFTGWAAMSIQSTTSTYLTDIFHDRSASASAALNLARCLMGAGGTAVVSPLANAMGVGWCFTLLSGIMLLALGVIVAGTVVERRRVSPTVSLRESGDDS